MKTGNSRLTTHVYDPVLHLHGERSILLIHLDAMTLVLPPMLLLGGAVLKARYCENIILILRQRSLPETKLAAVVLIVWSHCQHQPHIFLEKLLQQS